MKVLADPQGMRGDRGQASVEYIAIAGVVAVVLGAAVAITSGGLGSAVEASIRRGICTVTSESCPVLHAASLPSDLEVCPLARKVGNQQLSLDVGVVRLAAQLGLTIEKMSDGKVRVSFADGGKAGVGTAVGAHVKVGKWGGEAEATLDAGVAITSGKVWVLPNASAAERFIARYGNSQKLDGKIRQGIEKICPLCGTIAGAPAAPPYPDERWLSGGLAAGATVGIGVGPVSAKVDGTLRTAIGRRTTKSGTTWFTRVDARLMGVVDALGGGLDAQADSSGIASIELDRSGRPIKLKVVREGKISTREGLRLPVRLRNLIGDTRTGRGQAIESESMLELRTEADREAALGFLTAVRSVDPVAAFEAASRLRSAMDDHGQNTVRRWKLSRRVSGVGAGLALGIRLGADANSTTDDQRLASVASRIGRLGWLPRADCLAV